MRRLLLALCLFGSASPAHAQITISGGDFERGLRPGYNIPHDGAPFSHRYGYSTDMSSFYFGGNGWRLGYLEYLDRVDRAEKFGYRVPYDARYEFPSSPAPQAVPAETTVTSVPATQTRFGFGLGIFRRR